MLCRPVHASTVISKTHKATNIEGLYREDSGGWKMVRTEGDQGKWNGAPVDSKLELMMAADSSAACRKMGPWYGQPGGRAWIPA